MTSEPLVTILIPTFNNQQFLQPCLYSLLRNQATAGLFRVIVVNNGHPNSCDWVNHKQVTVIQAGSNLNWEGGIELGLKHTTSEFVVFLNDDTYIPPSSKLWVNSLLQHFKNPKVAAVGPSSNVVMGFQNIFTDLNVHVFTTTFLIGFCVMLRRSAFDEIGGMDTSCPGGDDLDWSIRLRKAGYRLLIDREVFIYHHGFKTGERVEGPASAVNGWNSYEKMHRTNTYLIQKHGFKEWWECMKGAYQLPSLEDRESSDLEGDLIRSLLTPQDRVVYDLGCGNNKTTETAIGVDYIPKDEAIPALDGGPPSSADVLADVSKPLPFPDESADVLISRHVLEHVIDGPLVLTQWLKILKPGGKLIIAVPNQDWMNTIPMNFEHVHAYTPSSMTNLLTLLGLKDIQIFNPENNISFVTLAYK